MVELDAEVDITVVYSVIVIIDISDCACVDKDIGLSNAGGSTLCAGAKVRTVTGLVTPVRTVSPDGAGAVVTARGAAVQVVPELVLTLIDGDDIDTSCPRLGPGPLEPGGF